MSSILKPNNSLLSKTWLFLTGSLFVFPILSLRLEVGLIGLWVFYSIFLAVKRKETSFKQNARLLVLFLSFPLFYAFSYLLSDHNREGSFEMEKSVALLIVPLFMAVAPVKIERGHVHFMIKIFTSAALLIGCYGFGSIFLQGWQGDFQEVHDFTFRVRADFEFWTGLHPTYASIIFLFGVLFFLASCFEKDSKRYDVYLYVSGSILLLIFSFLLVAKTPLIAFFVSLLCYVLFRQKGINRQWMMIGLFLVLGAATLMVPSVNRRFQEMVQMNNSNAETEQTNTVSMRKQIYQCAAQLLEEHWLMGVGFGSVQPALDDCYQSYETPAFKMHTYNSHNQYLSYWLRLGILGPILLLITLLLPAWWAIKSGDSFYLMFLIFIAICFLTENILERQHGVVFYILMTTSLAFSSKSKGINDL